MRHRPQVVVRGDAGAGSVLSVALVAVVLMLTLTLLPLYTALVTKRELTAAADSSALAAGDALLGAAPGYPCALAAEVARANGAMLADCRTEDAAVTVILEREVLGLPLRAAARAGAPDARHGSAALSSD